MAKKKAAVPTTTPPESVTIPGIGSVPLIPASTATPKKKAKAPAAPPPPEMIEYNAYRVGELFTASWYDDGNRHAACKVTENHGRIAKDVIGATPEGTLRVTLYPVNKVRDEIPLTFSGRQLLGPRETEYTLAVPNLRELASINRVIADEGKLQAAFAAREPGTRSTARHTNNGTGRARGGGKGSALLAAIKALLVSKTGASVSQLREMAPGRDRSSLSALRKQGMVITKSKNKAGETIYTSQG